MLPSSTSVLNVSNMNSWSIFSKSSTQIGSEINKSNITYNKINIDE